MLISMEHILSRKDDNFTEKSLEKGVGRVEKFKIVIFKKFFFRIDAKFCADFKYTCLE